MKKILLPLLFLFLLGCNKDENNDPLAGLPPETQTGANTFGCLIDGKLYLPRCNPPSLVFPEWGLIVWGSGNNGNYVEIEARDLKSEKGFNFLLHIEGVNLTREGVYLIDESNGYGDIDGLDHTYLHCTIFDYKYNIYKKYLSFENSGSLKLTRYGSHNSGNTNDHNTISGTFSSKLRNILDPTDEIEITNGRFDINTSTVIYKEFP
jgi:hypothetical protein